MTTTQLPVAANATVATPVTPAPAAASVLVGYGILPGAVGTRILRRRDTAGS